MVVIGREIIDIDRRNMYLFVIGKIRQMDRKRNAAVHQALGILRKHFQKLFFAQTRAPKAAVICG